MTTLLQELKDAKETIEHLFNGDVAAWSLGGSARAKATLQRLETTLAQQDQPSQYGARIQALVTSCKDCIHKQYYSSGIYECDETKAKLNPGEAFHALCPLQPLSDEINWPKARDVGRYGDMSPSAHIRVGLDSDNDVYVSVWDENGGATVEFCNGGGGGGRSPKTRAALINLMAAIEEENAKDPSRDWWTRRMGTAKGGAA
mgnify:CR=1 FL=1